MSQWQDGWPMGITRFLVVTREVGAFCLHDLSWVATVCRGWRAAVSAAGQDESFDFRAAEYPCSDLTTLECAARHGALPLVALLVESLGWDPKVHPRCGWSAASSGSVECLRYLRERGCRLDENAPRSAAMGDHVRCLEYLQSVRCPWDRTATDVAAKFGRMASLRFLMEHRAPRGPSAVLKTAKAGQLECLKFLVEAGCPWDENAEEEAAAAGQEECVTFLSDSRRTRQ